jgi:hypothetical protein
MDNLDGTAVAAENLAIFSTHRILANHSTQSLQKCYNSYNTYVVGE